MSFEKRQERRQKAYTKDLYSKTLMVHAGHKFDQTVKYDNEQEQAWNEGAVKKRFNDNERMKRDSNRHIEEVREAGGIKGGFSWKENSKHPKNNEEEPAQKPKWPKRQHSGTSKGYWELRDKRVDGEPGKKFDAKERQPSKGAWSFNNNQKQGPSKGDQWEGREAKEYNKKPFARGSNQYKGGNSRRGPTNPDDAANRQQPRKWEAKPRATSDANSPRPWEKREARPPRHRDGPSSEAAPSPSATSSPSPIGTPLEADNESKVNMTVSEEASIPYRFRGSKLSPDRIMAIIRQRRRCNRTLPQYIALRKRMRAGAKIDREHRLQTFMRRHEQKLQLDLETEAEAREGKGQRGWPGAYAAIAQALGLQTPSSVQTAAMQWFKAQDTAGAAKPGNSACILAAPTGTGKTLAYLLPIMTRIKRLEAQEPAPSPATAPPNGKAQPRAIIAVPSRELASQVFSTTKAITRHLKLRTEMAGAKSLSKSRADLVIGTPAQLVNSRGLSLERADTLVVDESDSTVLDDDSLAMIKRLGDKGQPFRTTCFVMATVPERVLRRVKALHKGLNCLLTRWCLACSPASSPLVPFV